MGSGVVVVVLWVVVRVVVGRVVVVVGRGVVVGRRVVVVVGLVVVMGARVVVLMTSKPTRGLPPRLKMGLSWALAKGLAWRPCPKSGKPSGLTTGVPPRSTMVRPSPPSLIRRGFPCESCRYLPSAFNTNPRSRSTTHFVP